MIKGLYGFATKWCEKGTIWLYSDPHFADQKAKEVISHRPSDEYIVKKINSRVTKNDTIIFLGDIGDTSFIRKINGYKVLITGIHDKGAASYKRQITTRHYDVDYWDYSVLMNKIKQDFPSYTCTIKKVCDCLHYFEYWNVTIDNKLFDEVYTGPLMISNKLILSHEPVEVDFAFNIHGHNHMKDNIPNHFNVCAECINYDPINLNSFIHSGAMSNIKNTHELARANQI